MLNKNYEIDEDKWYQLWIENEYFESEIDETKNPFTILIPPPNCTGNLHIGHALNNTFQDIMIRAKKLQGFNTCWVPGTDHGGIATQNVVEKQLLAEGKTKEDLGREEFLKRVWEWKESRRDTIIGQLKKLGCACDWDREQFTMSKELSQQVMHAFYILHQKGLIYKSNYIVNWCPRCQTALSDDEVEHKNSNDNKLYYIRYPLTNSSVYIVIATTRPETILGDTAVAYNPTDERHNMFKGMKVRIPIVNREVELIEDNYVKKEFGTGFVKITPCHDKNDYTIGKNHNLEFLNIIDEKGNIQNTGTQYDGMERFECRKQILIELSEMGLLDKVENHENAVGQCYRCDTVIEPRISDQWFVKMKDMMENGLKIVEDQEISLSPDYHQDIYRNWMTSDQDWCISRQIWWGHQIPIWYCENTDCENHSGYSRPGPPENCGKCGSNVTQDQDVLDTWFSSALWAFSVFDNKDINYYFPSDVLITGGDILFFWVARMIMITQKLFETAEKEKRIPFKSVYLHGVVRDKDGVKMSKTLGNVIDPLDIIKVHSADILRFTLAHETSFGQDVNIEMKTFNLGKTFCTKFWNSMRYILLNLPENTKLECDFVDYDFLDNTDKWIINKLNITIKNVTEYIDKYDFSAACKKLYEFLWEQFCPIYLEYAKTSIDEEMTQKILLLIIDNLNRLLHPFVPFLTEEIWQIIKKYFEKYDNRNSIMECEWPFVIDIGNYRDEYDVLFEVHQGVLGGIRKVRNEYDVNKKEHEDKQINIVIQSTDQELVKYIQNNQKPIHKLGRVSNIHYNKIENDKQYIKHKVNDTLIVAIEVDERFDFESKISKIQKIITQKEKKITKLQDQLKKSTAAPDSKKRKKKEEDIENIQQEISDMQREITSLKIMANKI